MIWGAAGLELHLGLREVPPTGAMPLSLVSFFVCLERILSLYDRSDLKCLLI